MRHTQLLQHAVSSPPGRAPLQSVELLERANQHIVASMAVKDCASEMARINMAHGLAKIHWVQQSLGYPADAHFIGAPDMTTTRYPTKWQWGQAIGGMLNWGDGTRPLTFLDLQISTSTALVGGLDREPDVRTIVARTDRLSRNRPTVMGIEADWDFGNGNHFINAYRVEPVTQVKLPPYAFVVHGGDCEVKRPSILGTGLDYKESTLLREAMKVVHTPLGPVRILRDQAAYDYHAMYLCYEEYSKLKCLALAEALFDTFSTISNVVHHGFADPNTALLSCYRFQPGSDTLYPVTLRSDLPTYLVRGICRGGVDPRPDCFPQDIAPEMLSEPSLDESARQRARTANILPHGGGYTFPEVTDVADTMEMNGHRYFILNTTNGAKRVVAHPGALPHSYRGLEVIDSLVRHQLGEIVAELHPLFSITT